MHLEQHSFAMVHGSMLNYPNNDDEDEDGSSDKVKRTTAA